jgi:4-hydroxy-tetrahydrodipicolinate synthase
LRTSTVTTDDLGGVFAVPPLARAADARRSLDFVQSRLIVDHVAGAGITRFLYGGNAFLYHLTLAEYEQLLDWLEAFPTELWAIPSIGPSYGRAMDQALVLRRFRFPAVMMLPCGDPRDATGLERGFREVADAAATPLIAYIKEEHNLGADRLAGLDAIGRLVADGVCVAIKYAIRRADPSQDGYLRELLQRVDRNRVISGLGERPVVAHLQSWDLPGFTTGSGCIAPHLSAAIFSACRNRDFAVAAKVRDNFMPLEDLRDLWNPSVVLHQALSLAELADAGPVPPYLSPLSAEQLQDLAPVARSLLRKDQNASKGLDTSVLRDRSVPL